MTQNKNKINPYSIQIFILLILSYIRRIKKVAAYIYNYTLQDLLLLLMFSKTLKKAEKIIVKT